MARAKYVIYPMCAPCALGMLTIDARQLEQIDAE